MHKKALLQLILCTRSCAPFAANDSPPHATHLPQVRDICLRIRCSKLQGPVVDNAPFTTMARKLSLSSSRVRSRIPARSALLFILPAN